MRALILLFVVLTTRATKALNIAECQGQTCNVTNVSFVLDQSLYGGYTTDSDSITLYNSKTPRLYMTIDGSYKKMGLLGKQLQFDVDVSTAPCGSDAALYFSDMSSSSPIGTGYCDAQTTCNEMDVYEGNSIANALTSHSCNGGSCDPYGCGVNTLDIGFSSINTKSLFTVITQFVESNGKLSKIARKYRQNGKSYDGGSLNSCSRYGGFDNMSPSLSEGMVMVISIWGNGKYDMSWLDKCSVSSYNNASIVDAYVKFSNIIFGDIDGNYSSVKEYTPSSSTLIPFSTPSMMTNQTPTPNNGGTRNKNVTYFTGCVSVMD